MLKKSALGMLPIGAEQSAVVVNLGISGPETVRTVAAELQYGAHLAEADHADVRMSNIPHDVDGHRK